MAFRLAGLLHIYTSEITGSSVNYFISGDTILLHGNHVFNELPFRTANFIERGRIGQQGFHYEKEFSVQIDDIDSENVYNLRNKDLLIIFQDANGTVYVTGQEKGYALVNPEATTGGDQHVLDVSFTQKSYTRIQRIDLSNITLSGLTFNCTTCDSQTIPCGSGGTGSIIGATSLGGVALYASELAGILQFKGISAGSNISLTSNANDIVIAATGLTTNQKFNTYTGSTQTTLDSKVSINANDGTSSSFITNGGSSIEISAEDSDTNYHNKIIFDPVSTGVMTFSSYDNDNSSDFNFSPTRIEIITDELRLVNLQADSGQTYALVVNDDGIVSSQPVGTGLNSSLFWKTTGTTSIASGDTNVFLEADDVLTIGQGSSNGIRFWRSSDFGATRIMGTSMWLTFDNNNILGLGSGTRFTDGRATKRGMEYAGDYSTGFTKHSLVDVNYVTGITSTLSGGTGTVNPLQFWKTSGTTSIIGSSSIAIGGNEFVSFTPNSSGSVFEVSMTSAGNFTMGRENGTPISYWNVNDDDGNKVGFTLNPQNDNSYPSGVTFTDERRVKEGIRYNGNYSTGFTKHSLVDVNYVTGHTDLVAVDIASGTTSYTVTESDYGKRLRFFANTDVTITLPNLRANFVFSITKVGLGNLIPSVATGLTLNVAGDGIINTQHTGAFFHYLKDITTWETSGAYIEEGDLPANSVGNTELTDMAANSIKGRSSGSGDPEDLTATQVRSIIDVYTRGQVTAITDTLLTKSAFVIYSGGTRQNILNSAVTGATNLANTTGANIFTSKNGRNLEFKSLYPGSGITLTETSTGITINSTATGSASGSRVLYQNNTPISHSGSTARVKMDSFLIPAGTLQADDTLKITILTTKTNVNGNLSIEVDCNTTDAVGGTLIFPYINSLNGVFSKIERDFHLVSTTSQYVFNTSSTANITDLLGSNTTATLTNTSVNFNSNVWIVVSFDNGNVNDITYLRSWRVELLRA